MCMDFNCKLIRYYLFSFQIKYASRKKVAENKPLYITKCMELANHYLGFNGWNSKIISVMHHLQWLFWGSFMRISSINLLHREYLEFNPFNVEATFVQSTRTQNILKIV